MTLSVAIIGAGMMGRWHARAAGRAGARVVAVVDPLQPAAAALAHGLAGAEPYATLDAAVAAAHVDVVHVCTPAHTHAAIAEAAILAGAHVLVEKPFTENAASTGRLLDLAESRSRLACPVHQFLFQRGVVEAAAALRQIGPLRHLTMTVCSAGAAGASLDEVDRVAREVFPHPLAMAARFVPGRLSEVQWMVLHPAPGEWLVSGAAGTVGLTFLVSMGGRPPRNELQFVAERGSVSVDLFHGFAVVERGGVSRMRKALRPLALSGRTSLAALANLARRTGRAEWAYPGLGELVGRFYAAVLNHASAPIQSDEVRAVAEATDRILEAGIPKAPRGPAR